MKTYTLHLVYFSPTGTTSSILEHIALGMEGPAMNRVERHNLTCPDARKEALVFDQGDVVLLGMPVYYGRIPKLFHEYTQFEGRGALVVPVVVYGNRDYDDALLELRDVAEARGFVTLAAGAFVAEHCLNRSIATGRPDAHDIEQATLFGASIAQKLASSTFEALSQTRSVLPIKGSRPYKTYGSLSFVPGVNSELCTACGICESKCPVGVIEGATFTVTERSACIACFACVTYCPAHARSLDAALKPVFDKGMEQLAQKCTEHKEAEYFL